MTDTSTTPAGPPTSTSPAVHEQGGETANPLPLTGRTLTMPRLMDWLQSELLSLTRPLTSDREREMRCEEFVDGDHLVLRVELPGVDPERDVDVSVSSGVLTVRAERRKETHEDGHRSEFFYGMLVRTFVLPSGADENGIAASYRDGVLEVRVPVRATPARSVPIARTTP